MDKIWAKIVVNHRVKQSIIHTAPDRIDILNFWDNVKQICEELKIPTPVILTCHAENFLELNTLKLKPTDFIEDVPFDWLLLENGE